MKVPEPNTPGFRLFQERKRLFESRAEAVRAFNKLLTEEHKIVGETWRLWEENTSKKPWSIIHRKALKELFNKPIWYWESGPVPIDRLDSSPKLSEKALHLGQAFDRCSVDIQEIIEALTIIGQRKNQGRAKSRG